MATCALMLLSCLPAAWSFAITPNVLSQPLVRTAFPSVFHVRPRRRSSRLVSMAVTERDVVVVGSGLAGLSSAALLAHCGLKVTVCESHNIPGGCAHSWTRQGYHFESGPSLYSGLSRDSPNPMKNVLQIIGEEPEWITYDRWGTIIPEAPEGFAAKIGPEEFGDVLLKYGGEGAVEDWAKLTAAMEDLGDAAQALTSMALREDAGVLATTMLRYPKETVQTLLNGGALTEPFSKVVERYGITNRFVLNWLDMLCFLLQGLPSSGTLSAVIAYMLADWYKPGVTLDFPKGGSGAIVDALVRGVTKYGGELKLAAHVEQVLVEGGRAVGVQLRGGDVIEASTAVVLNTDLWTTRKLVPLGAYAPLDTYLSSLLDKTVPLKSFIHIHAGIDATGLPSVASADFPAQWAVVNSWDVEEGVEAPRNVVLVSMPSLIDPGLAPPGKHVIHAYTPATEPYEWWEGLQRGSAEYKAKKAEAAAFLWDAIEKYVPDARKRSDPTVEQIGTPLTHERFLRRSRGTYGVRAVAGEDMLPGHKTPLEGLMLAGDFTFPGIGVPATAASGAIVANTLVSLPQHWQMLDKIRLVDSK